MENIAQDHLTLFAENARIIKKEFFFQNTSEKRLAALLYAQAGKTIDCEAIRQCHALIKESTGIFSYFRGDMALSLAALLSLSANPRAVFSQTLQAYHQLKEEKFYASDFLVIAAYQIAAQADAPGYADVIARTRAFYNGMKARQAFQTGKDDYILAAMLGLSDLDTEAGGERIARFYDRLKGKFGSKNSVQALAQVLALGGADDDVENRVFALRDALRAQKIRLDKTYTLPVLGILALLAVDVDMIVQDIGSAQAYLRAQKGFGAFSLNSQELLLFAAAITAGKYAQGEKSDMLTATLSTSITNIIIAQQTAMIMAMTASSRVAAASAASN